MKFSLFAILLFLISQIYSQNLFTSGEFEESLLKSVLLDSLNERRSNQYLPLLELDEILEASAFVQAEYIAKQEKFNHQQENSKFKTLMDRVNYYGGRYAGLGENIFSIQTAGEKNRRRSRSDIELRSYEEVTLSILKAWEDDEESFKNIYDPDFLQIGISVLFDSVNHELALVSVFGTEAYPTREGLKIQDDAGFKEYDRNICDKLLTEFPAVEEFLGSSILVDGKQIWLKNVDKSLIEKILNSNSDALVADVICTDQFPCNGGNRLFPGNIQSGYLLKPIRKINYSTKLVERKANEFDLLLGELPPVFNSSECEANLLLIKENTLCATAPYNHFDGKNISWLNIPFQYSFLSDSIQTQSWTDSLSFSFHSESSKKSTLAKLDSLLTYFGNTKPEIISAQAEIYYSPIQAKRANAKNWKTILKEELKNYQLKVENLHFSEKIAWNEYQKFISNRIYSLETQKLDSLELEEYLKDEYAKGGHLSVFLDSLNKINLKIYKINSWKNESNPQLLEMYRYFLQHNKAELALRVQKKLIDNTATPTKKELVTKPIPLKQEYSDLANNQLLLKISNSGFDPKKGKTIKQSFGEILFVDRRNKIVQYNFLVASVKEWSSSINAAPNTEEWFDIYQNIRNNARIPDSNLSKLLLNYYMLLADYNYENQKFEKRKEALEEATELILSKNLTEKEANFYAEYLMFQLQLPAAIHLLKKYALGPHPTEQTLKNILSISKYDYDVLNKEEIMVIYQKYSELYPNGFCMIFNQENMGIQALTHRKIKELYCESCK